MDGIDRLCVRCQAQLESGARFCPACGLRADPAASAGRVATETAPAGGLGPAAGGGPGSAVAVPVPRIPASPTGDWSSGPLRDPLPTGPPEYPPSSAPSAATTRSDWILPAAPQPPAGVQPGFGPPPYQHPPPYQPAPYQPLGGPPGGPPRQPPRRHDRNRSGSSLALWILLPLLLVGGLAAVLVAEHPFSHSSPPETASADGGTGSAALAGSSAGTDQGGSPSPASTASDSGPAGAGAARSPVSPAAPAVAAVTEQQAAATVASMLTQSGADRAATISAAADVADCGPGLVADPKAFEDAAASRQALLTSLGTIPGRAALPAGLLSDLASAWQASVSADQAYARWATDEIARGCVHDDTSDPGYQAAQTPDKNATQDKAAFTQAWNPIATRYGLTQYQPDQL
jgi:hypothetical protein